MKKIKQFFRLQHINLIFIKHGLDEIVTAIALFRPLRIFTYFNPYNWRRERRKARGVRLREALEELGPIFVKFGQLLSTRADLIPEDIALELEKLQDRVPPFSSEEARKIILESYQKKPEQLFAEFSETPLASASIAQVHPIKLFDGTDAVIKILRPRVGKMIRRDIDLMYLFARLLEKYWSQAYRVHPVQLVQEFEQVIFDELDLIREAANASQIRYNFRNSDILYTPEIYWDYATERCIVMERIYGIAITNIAALKKHRINFKKLAELGVEIFFTQVFRDSFFHADMHAGNIFVNPNRSENPQYIGVDFGIVGSLSPADQRYLAENFVAFFNRDYRKVAQLHIDSGWVPPDTRIDQFASAIRAVCEPIMQRPLSEISFGKMLMRLFQIGRRFNMDVQPQLMLLQKTLLSIEGLGRRLYPDLDLWETAKPFLEKWLREKKGLRQNIKRLREELPNIIERMPEVPGLLYGALESFKSSRKTAINIIKPLPIKKLNWLSFGIGLGFAAAFLITFFTTGQNVSANHSLFQIEIIAALLFFLIAVFNK